MDDDNEVRDRATFYLNVLEQKQKVLNAGYILNGESSRPSDPASCGSSGLSCGSRAGKSQDKILLATLL
jgi:hypothetical protein